MFPRTEELLWTLHSRSPVGVLGHIYLPFLARGLSTAGQVHRVAEEAVTRHPLTYDPCHDLSSMDANGDLRKRKNEQNEMKNWVIC